MAYLKLLKRLSLLAFPFLLLAACIYWTDPFCLLRSPFIPREVKQKSAFLLNVCLARLIEYEQHPGPNILLGDSRMTLLRPAEIELVSGEKFIDMSYGGASLNELVDTFWTANKAVALKKVYIGVGFNLYNDYNFSNRTESAMAIIDSPLLYFTNRTVLKGAWYTAGLQYLGKDPALGKPGISREQLWAQELKAQADWSERYLPPVRYRARLTEISEYCHKEGIDLRFIIFPSQADLQAIPHRFGLDLQYLQFKQDLARFGRLYDFDLPSPLTADRENYKDPVHFREPIAKRIIKQIWGSGTPDR